MWSRHASVKIAAANPRTTLPPHRPVPPRTGSDVVLRRSSHGGGCGGLEARCPGVAKAGPLGRSGLRACVCVCERERE